MLAQLEALSEQSNQAKKELSNAYRRIRKTYLICSNTNVFIDREGYCQTGEGLEFLGRYTSTRIRIELNGTECYYINELQDWRIKERFTKVDKPIDKHLWDVKK